jgi:UDP-N-acetylmuramate dehydrogenase
MNILENVLLSTLTTFRTGGPARFLLTIESKEKIADALAFAKERGLPLIPMGTGSNMLAPDEGVNAVFLRLATKDISAKEQDGTVTIIADAGIPWDELVEYAVQKGWWGIENLSAIPGTVGAAVVQNIGAYGAALSDVAHTIEAFDTELKQFRIFTPEECRFGYRTSIFKQERDRYFITQVSFHLSKNSRPNLSYRDLKNFFADKEASLQEIRNAVVSIRRGKFPPLDDYGTAGSFFLNPIVTPEEQEALSKQFPTMPFFPLPEGGIKLPLAWLLDHALSLKGTRIGKAFLWDEQPLVIAAEAGAASEDVVSLASDVARAILEKTGIVIMPEVRLFGAEEKIRGSL